jgi:hypothetical protein
MSQDCFQFFSGVCISCIDCSNPVGCGCDHMWGTMLQARAQGFRAILPSYSLKHNKDMRILSAPHKEARVTNKVASHR